MSAPFLDYLCLTGHPESCTAVRGAGDGGSCVGSALLLVLLLLVAVVGHVCALEALHCTQHVPHQHRLLHLQDVVTAHEWAEAWCVLV